MIKNSQDLYDLYEAENERQFARWVYKDTECGASVEFRDNQVRLTAIVEGSDAEFASEWLTYPFSLRDWHQAIEGIESLVEVALQEAEGFCTQTEDCLYSEGHEGACKLPNYWTGCEGF